MILESERTAVGMLKILVCSLLLFFAGCSSQSTPSPSVSSTPVTIKTPIVTSTPGAESTPDAESKPDAERAKLLKGVEEKREILSKDPQNPRKMNSAAWAHALAGHYEEGFALAEKSFLLEEGAHTKDTMAFCLVGMGKYKEAIKAYDEAIALRPLPDSYFGRGKANEMLGNKEVAEKDYQEARNLDANIDLKWPEPSVYAEATPTAGE